MRRSGYLEEEYDQNDYDYFDELCARPWKKTKNNE